MSQHILVVEDELPIRQMLTFALTRQGYKTFEAATIKEANDVIQKERIHLILLDCMIPDKSGINWLTEIKKIPPFHQLPVIMLTARAEETNKIRAFDAGADDYITKPFSPKELLARIQAVIRRSYPELGESNPAKANISYPNITLDIENHRLLLRGKKTKIGPLEFKLLHYLMRHPEKALSREKLLDKVWGDQAEVMERTVDVHIRRVRKILEKENLENLIESVRAVGYRFSTTGQKS